MILRIVLRSQPGSHDPATASAKPGERGRRTLFVRHHSLGSSELSQKPPKKRSETADKYGYEDDDPKKAFVYVAFADDHCEPVFQHLSLA
ncbi:hypothetical protein LPU83_pLPU83c_0519 (plasmid) [Rhizobium favelukesii]|uniref:Uncharacterized protein n=1 Tax=Rhizobium favelukesii TaxID=348824 RepID=W6S437_9HYPH|nr:hypothetical protein LPU83_pLPU83c_0519 [Rhizobium favelukesii]